MKKARYWNIDERLAYWHPVLEASALRRSPRAIDVCGVPIVLFREGEDRVSAIYDRCAHRRAPLSAGKISPDGLVCAYHGCIFSGDGSGYCPTTRSSRFRVPTFEVRERHDTLWLRSPDACEWTGTDLEADIGFNPGFEDRNQVFAGVIHKEIDAPLQLVLDNMTELEHTGAVHKSLAFGQGDFDTVETNCEANDERVHIFYKGRQRPLPFYLRALSGLRHGDLYVQSANVTFTPPHADYHISWQAEGGHEERGFRLRFIIYYTPIDATRTRLFAYIYWDAEGALRRAALRASAPVLKAVVSAELGRDKAIIELMPHDEANLMMFQLSKFDRPLILSRRLMSRYYGGKTPPEGTDEAASGFAREPGAAVPIIEERRA